jgi:ubiquinone/menaquinone biosynthesis C-methylase UbiE
MKLSAVSLAVVLANASRSALGFQVRPDGNDKMMQKAVEEALLTTVKAPEGASGEEFPPLRNQVLGTEVPCMFEYWKRPDIHTFGNMGFGGALHAAMAPIATHIIDVKAYGGVDVRKSISHELRELVDKTGARVADLCCGVGMSTRALESAFHDAEFVVGVDTSEEMISMAETISGYETGLRLGFSRHNEALKKIMKERFKAVAESISVIDTNPYPSSRTAAQASYRLGNAENTALPDVSFDLVTIMYGFHEVPMAGRARIINEAKRLLRRGGHLAIVDICPTYTPSPHMLAGEPFVKEYQQNIDSQLATFPGFKFKKRKVVVPGHVNMWLLTAVA